MYVCVCVCVYVNAHNTNKYIYIKLATIIKGDPKAPFSLATAPRRGEGATSLS